MDVQLQTACSVDIDYNHSILKHSCLEAYGINVSFTMYESNPRH